MIFRTSSTPVFEAASISKTSVERPSVISTHCPHTPHGVAVGAPDAAGAGSVLETLCDDLRSVEDLTDVHAAAGLFRAI